MEYCKEHCKSQGYSYAGVQYGKECWCGNSFGKHGLAGNQNECNKKCSDKAQSTCGGTWRANIYLTAKPEPRTISKAVPSSGFIDCSSNDFEYAECKPPSGIVMTDIVLNKQYSSSGCKKSDDKNQEGGHFGINSNGLSMWVNNGCRGRFEYFF